jgi:hypothetical protein
MKNAVRHGGIPTRRGQIDMIGLRPLPIFDLLDRHAGEPLKQAAEHSRMGRIQVLDNDIGNVRTDGEIWKKSLEGFKPSCRGSDSHHDEGTVLLSLNLQFYGCF